MIYRLLADLTLLLHFAFVLFVVLGGLLVLRWVRMAWLHLPAAAWGAVVEYMGWICPLTPLENRFRGLAGETGYAGGFVDHYLLPIIYPEALTRDTQFVLGTIVVLINGVVYTWVVHRHLKQKKTTAG
jgi:Protein of Unknown function (DUF2784)